MHLPQKLSLLADVRLYIHEMTAPAQIMFALAFLLLAMLLGGGFFVGKLADAGVVGQIPAYPPTPELMMVNPATSESGVLGETVICQRHRDTHPPDRLRQRGLREVVAPRFRCTAIPLKLAP
jgi:hypothetical protein